MQQLSQHHQRALGGATTHPRHCPFSASTSSPSPHLPRRHHRSTAPHAKRLDDSAARSMDDEDAHKVNAMVAGAPAASQVALNLAFESDAAAAAAAAAPSTSALMQKVVKTTGLHRAPLSGGVRSATIRYDLPSPPVAVRNLVEIAHFGHLCTMMSGMHHRRAGYPFGTVIDFAADGAGYPVFCLSPLAIHSRNLLQDPRCSLVVQMPGWTGLANARVTIFGDVYQLSANMQAAAQQIFIAKHGGRDRWLSGNFVYFRMSRIVDIYFVGGFGTVQWITPEEYLSSRPDDIVLDSPAKLLQMLTEKFSEHLTGPMTAKIGEPVTEVQFVSIDASGADIRVRTAGDFNVQRIGFPTKVHTADEAVSSLREAVAAMQHVARQADAKPASGS